MIRCFPSFRCTDALVLAAMAAALALFAWRDADLVRREGLVPALAVAAYAAWRWRR